MSLKTYSCNRLYHLFDVNSTRDKHYRESSGRWINCTNARCPLRYNTREVPRNIVIPEGFTIPATPQERQIKSTYGNSDPLVVAPPPAGSSASPRIASSSLPSPTVGTSGLTRPEKDEDSEPEDETETVEPKRSTEPETFYDPSEEPTRRALPSFMSGTTTFSATAESISMAHRHVFQPAGGGGGG